VCCSRAQTALAPANGAVAAAAGEPGVRRGLLNIAIATAAMAVATVLGIVLMAVSR
jgi:hypothetical protein